MRLRTTIRCVATVSGRFLVVDLGNHRLDLAGRRRRDDAVIQVGPATDPPMVGYPQFFELGLLVRSLYNPEVQVGRQMQVTSSVPKANVTWPIVRVTHDLATMLRKGPWFTTAILQPLTT